MKRRNEMFMGRKWVQAVLITAVGIVLFQPTVAAAQGMPTLKQGLEDRGVPAKTKADIIAALRNKDAQVRRLAVEELAAEGLPAAKPVLLEALARESDPVVRVEIAYFLGKVGEEIGKATIKSILQDNSTTDQTRLVAGYALTRLGDSSGEVQIAAVCNNQSDPAMLRMKAAVDAQLLDKHYCDDAVLAVLTTYKGAVQLSFTDKDALVQALQILPRLESAAHDKDTLASVAAAQLESPSVPVRITAADTLVRLKAPSAIPALKRAEAVEPVGIVRDVIERSLKQISGGDQ